jgi:hypothetical protein
MAYFIFLKYLDSLEDFRKNPHVKIPSKSPCANFQILPKSKFQIKFEKVLFIELGPAQVSAQPPGPWPSAGQLSTPPHSFWAFASRPARPSPSLSLNDTWAPPLRLPPLAAATGRPSATGSPLGCPAELHPLPVTDALPHLLSPLRLPASLTPSRPKRPAIKPPPIPLRRSVQELPHPPYKSHREHRPSSLPPSPLS